MWARGRVEAFLVVAAMLLALAPGLVRAQAVAVEQRLAAVMADSAGRAKASAAGKRAAFPGANCQGGEGNKV